MRYDTTRYRTRCKFNVRSICRAEPRTRNVEKKKELKTKKRICSVVSVNIIANIDDVDESLIARCFCRRKR